MKTIDTLLARLDAIFLPTPELLHNLATAEEPPSSALPASASAASPTASVVSPAISAFTSTASAPALPTLLQALGGRDNLVEAGCVGLTRLRLELRAPADGPMRARIDAAASACGVLAVMWCSDTVAHLVAGRQAPALAVDLQEVLAGSPSTAHAPASATTTA